MNRISLQRGFALLMVIMLVAIGSVTMVTVAQTSMREAVTAMRAERQLQQRWAVRSLQRYLLPNCNKLLEDTEKQQHQSLPAINASITLGEESFDLVICDEQAKANVNTLFAIKGIERCADSVRTLINEANLDLQLHLKPHNVKARTRQNKVSLPVFSSYNQLFANQTIAGSRLVEATDKTRPLAEQLTFWGDGKVNLNRVPPEVLYEVCESYLDADQIELILERREEHQYEQYNPEEFLYDEDENSEGNSVETGPMTIAEALTDFELKDEQKAGLLKVLAEESSCYSLWIIHRMPLRSWYHLSVHENNTATDGGQPQPEKDKPQKDTQQEENDSPDKTNETQVKDKIDTDDKDTQSSQPTLAIFSFEW